MRFGFETFRDLMPPRKRARTSGSKLATDVVAGASQASIATSMDDLPPIMKIVGELVDGMHSVRHADSATLHLDGLGPLAAKDGVLPWPVMHGGTFRQIAQRAWQDPEKLIEMSASVACKVGLCDTADPVEFQQQFCKVEAGNFKALSL